MTTSIEIRDLPARLNEALAFAAAGGEVLLLDGQRPCARLLPLTSERVAGLHPGAIQTFADFDAPLSDEFWVGQP